MFHITELKSNSRIKIVANANKYDVIKFFVCIFIIFPKLVSKHISIFKSDNGKYSIKVFEELSADPNISELMTEPNQSEAE